MYYGTWRAPRRRRRRWASGQVVVVVVRWLVGQEKGNTIMTLIDPGRFSLQVDPINPEEIATK